LEISLLDALLVAASFASSNDAESIARNLLTKPHVGIVMFGMVDLKELVWKYPVRDYCHRFEVFISIQQGY
jgi:hypothetical protein